MSNVTAFDVLVWCTLIIEIVADIGQISWKRPKDTHGRFGGNFIGMSVHQTIPPSNNLLCGVYSAH